MKICPKCNKVFVCKPHQEGQCWCKDLPPLLPVPCQGQCLCKECLLKMSYRDHPVYAEVATAYADCGLSDYDDEVWQIRNIGFRASQAVNAAMAKAIMQDVCNSYNDFDCKIFDLFPDDCQIVLAREGSVCIYVSSGNKPLPTREQIEAQEYNVMTHTKFGQGTYQGSFDGRSTPYGGFEGETRIWWD